jgi:hypothetical protein
MDDRGCDPSPWLVGLCSVHFDIDAGQTVGHVVPEGALTPEESKAVAFHAFPVRVCVVFGGGGGAQSAACVRYGVRARRPTFPPCPPPNTKDSMSLELTSRNSVRDRWVFYCLLSVARGGVKALALQPEEGPIQPH